MMREIFIFQRNNLFEDFRSVFWSSSIFFVFFSFFVPFVIFYYSPPVDDSMHMCIDGDYR